MAKIQKTTPEERAQQQANIDRARRLAEARLAEIERRKRVADEEKN